jgi:hypothetical protein
MSVKRVSMIVGLLTLLIPAQCCSYCLFTSFWLLLYTKRLKNTSWLLCKWNQLLLFWRMWLEYPVHISLYRLPYSSVWMLEIKHHLYSQRCKTKYCWHSVEAYFQDVVGKWVCLFCTSRWLIRQKWTVTYQYEYCTINSSISECMHQCETQNAEPEIETEVSWQIWWNLRVDGYRSRFDLPRLSRSGFWMGHVSSMACMVRTLSDCDNSQLGMYFRTMVSS